jgi:putative pyruvate formate lyase activating enzyme
MSVSVEWVVHGLTPSYLDLGVEEIRRKATAARSLLGPDRCLVCPRLCKVDRLADRKGLRAIGRRAIVASHFPHFGEENCLRRRNGSGTIFFSGCNLRCVFCQNHDISWQVRLARSRGGPDAQPGPPCHAGREPA